MNRITQLALITLITVIVLPLLSGCKSLVSSEGEYGPLPFLMRSLPQGNDEFSQGFRDGCYNFIGQNGHGWQRLYDAPPDPRKLASQQYHQGYAFGDRYCGVYVNKGIIL